MDFSELHPRKNSQGIAQVGWSGVAPLEVQLSSTAVANIAAALPRLPIDMAQFHRTLETIARRFHRSMRQSEFGPTRPDKKAMIKEQLPRLEKIKDLLSILSAEPSSELSTELYNRLSGTKWINSDMLIEAISDAELSAAGNSEVVTAIQETCIWLVQCTDTNTASDLLLDELSDPHQRITLPPREDFSSATLRDWIDQILARRATLLRVRGRGPEPLNSLWSAVFWLAELFKKETGQRVTHYYREGFIGPQTAADRFILNAVTELLPPISVFPAGLLAELNVGLCHSPRDFKLLVFRLSSSM